MKSVMVSIGRGIEIIPDHPDHRSIWPPVWLSETTVTGPSPRDSDDLPSPPSEAIETREPVTDGTHGEAGFDPDALAELEPLLAAIEAEVRRLTRDPVLLRAVANLLNDCRDMAREGMADLALRLARDYQTRFPAYIREHSSTSARGASFASR